MMPTTWKSIVVAAGLGLCGSGCLHVDHALHLHQDGSGILEFQYGVPLHQWEEWQALGASIGFEVGEPRAAQTWMSSDASAIRTSFEVYDPELLKLEDVAVSMEEGWRSVRMRVAFASLEDLATAQLIDPGHVTLRQNDAGHYVYSVRPAAPGSQADPGRISPGFEQVLDEMAIDFRVRLSVEMPGRLLETNGERVGERETAWTFDAAEDPDAVRTITTFSPRAVFEPGGLRRKPFGLETMRLFMPAPGGS